MSSVVKLLTLTNTAQKFPANKYRELDEGFSKVPIALARADLRKRFPTLCRTISSRIFSTKMGQSSQIGNFVTKTEQDCFAWVRESEV